MPKKTFKKQNQTKSEHGKNNNENEQQIIQQLNDMNKELIKLLKQQSELKSMIKECSEELNEMIEENLTSDEYRNFLQDTLGLIDTSFGKVAKQYLNKEIELTTNGGLLNGRIAGIKKDYLIFNEEIGYETLVPYVHIESIMIKGSV